jgi:predicted Zn finger-like uncharacterized protein
LILTCEKCDTRFRLDESRLPAKGARVRCSRCKHAFFVQPPGSGSAEAIDALAADAARTGQPAKPDVSWDLDESADPSSTLQRSRSAPVAEAPAPLDDESDWRFEDEVPQLGDSGASLDLPNGEAPVLSAEPDANESSFAQLGDPESWDLLSTSSGDLGATGNKAIGGLQAPPPRVVESKPVREVEPAAAPRHAAAPIAAQPEEAPAVATPRRVVEAPPQVRAAGYAATVALAAALLAGALRATPAPVAEPLKVAVGPLAIENLSARVVENVFAGPIWVVSGEIHNATREAHRLDTGVGVMLLDRGGDPIPGALALAQPAVDAANVAGDEPEAMQERATIAAGALAEFSLAPDARVAFDAVFPSAPRDAARFAIAPQPLAQRPAPPAEAPAAPPPQPEAASEPAVPQP